MMKHSFFKMGLAFLLGISSILFILALMGITVQVVYAAGPRYVAPGGSDSGNNCASIATPCATIQHAVDVADPGDVIKMSAGAYTGVNSYEGLSQVVYISKSVTLQGGYTSAFTEPPNPAANPTTLDAQGQGRVIYIVNTITVTIEGLRITGGNATGQDASFEGDIGGGVYAVTATVTLSGNTIFNNVANTSKRYGLGGGIGMGHNIVTLQGNHILSNTAGTTNGLIVSGEGGGVYLFNSLATLNDNTIQNNLASLTGEGDGGGVAVSYGTKAIFNNNIILGNTASKGFNVEGYGGGVFLFQSEAVLNRNLILHNTANLSGWIGIGGGLLLRDAKATLAGNSILSNTASLSSDIGAGGGIGLRYDSEISLEGDLIQGNRALGSTLSQGGGLYFEGWGMNPHNNRLTNTVIISNQVNQQGGGIFVGGKNSLQLLHPTIAHNTGGDGSGVYAAAQGFIQLTNGIIANQVVGVKVLTSNSATLEGILWYNNGVNMDGPGTITVTNAYTGNPTFAEDGYHLDQTSAAIDKGLAAGVGTDIDAEARDEMPDLGADEFLPPPILIEAGQRWFPGGTITLHLYEHVPNSPYDIWLDRNGPQASLLASIVTNAEGEGTLSYSLPATLPLKFKPGYLIQSYLQPGGNPGPATELELIVPLTLHKSALATIPIGLPFTYTLRVTNAMPFPLTNLVLTDTLPTGARYITGGTKVGQVVSWTLSNLAPGASVTRTFVVTTTRSLTNSDYAVQAGEGAQGKGTTSVVTVIKENEVNKKRLYLPLLVKNE
jgi:uncharacterized repeat protein (TIGR01451 family)